MSSRRHETINNYANWLRPFIKWLEDKSSSGYVHITSQLLAEYLNDRYARGEHSSYMRVGKQIAAFVNRDLHDKVEVLKPLRFKRAKDNVQMPPATLQKLMAVAKDGAAALMNEPATRRAMQQAAKYLGKYTREPPPCLIRL